MFVDGDGEYVLSNGRIVNRRAYSMIRLVNALNANFKRTGDRLSQDTINEYLEFMYMRLLDWKEESPQGIDDIFKSFFKDMYHLFIKEQPYNHLGHKHQKLS